MKTCSMVGCNNEVKAKGYCHKHYVRFKRYGNSSTVKIELHGMKKTPEYQVWQNLKKRCNNITHKNYMYYGGRGISVCESWDTSFINFYNDMGKRPFPEAQIDRIDNDKGYSKDNCEWVSPLQNMRHTSRTKLSMEKAREIRNMYFKENHRIIDISKVYKVSPTAISSVITNRTWKEKSWIK